jgi:glycoside/pentoside/hexuronide:cation symporter, GPH family
MKGVPSGAAAYAAPSVGSFFFYIPMWSILPGIYAKHFGLALTSIAAIVLFIRLFDGIIDTTIGYLSDWHRARGGSRKSWAIVGGLGSIAACYFLFQPPQPASGAYYLTWSLVYFLFFTIAEIPHATWGAELTLDYQGRAQVFGMRYVMTRLGMIVFYALPLLPWYVSTEYTPEVLRDAVAIGAVLSVLGLAWAVWRAPPGVATVVARQDSWRLFVRSLIANKPLLVYASACGCLGLAGGMWYALIFFYLDSYLGLGKHVAMMFLAATVIAAVSTPLWLKLIGRTSKTAVWTLGVALFALQLLVAAALSPGISWCLPFLLIVIANMFFSCHDIAAPSSLGDIVDYGKLKYHKDRGATYFGLNTLIFKVALGLGGGVALGITGLLGFEPSAATHEPRAVLGLKLAFVVLPLVFAALGAVLAWRMPITPQRHRIIQRRLEARMRLAIAQVGRESQSLPAGLPSRVIEER